MTSTTSNTAIAPGAITPAQSTPGPEGTAEATQALAGSDFPERLDLLAAGTAVRGGACGDGGEAEGGDSGGEGDPVGVDVLGSLRGGDVCRASAIEGQVGERGG